MLDLYLDQTARLISAGRVFTPTEPDVVSVRIPGYQFRASTWGMIMLCSQNDHVFFDEQETNIFRIRPDFVDPSEKGIHVIFKKQNIPTWLIGNIEATLFHFADPETPGTITQLGILSTQIRAIEIHDQINSQLHRNGAR